MSFFNEMWDGLQGGFLRKPLKKMTGLSDLQLGGLAAATVLGAPYVLPAMGAGGASGASAAGSATGAGQAGATAGQAGLFDSVMGYGKTALGGLKEYGPAGAQAVDAAYKAKAMSQGQPQQYAPAQFAQGQGFGGLLTPMEQFDPEKRRRDQQMAVQGLLGGYRG